MAVSAAKITGVELRGVVRPDLPLLVVALHEEAEALDGALPILVTGPGKVHSGVAVAVTLASTRPAAVINLGTAGALRDGIAGIHDIHTVIQHDFDGAAIHAVVGRVYGQPIELQDATAAGPVLATGDRFIADTATRSALARDAHLVDMEGYAVAWAARTAGVPVRLVKLVSDDAGEDAGRTWAQTVGEHSRTLADWVNAHLRH